MNDISCNNINYKKINIFNKNYNYFNYIEFKLLFYSQ